MSRKPTSAPERAAAIEHLERCGWSNAELIWEQIQEAAAQARLSGDEEEAAKLWQGALETAESYFTAPDPRLVTSRVNAALGRYDGDILVDAARDWRNAEAWVADLDAPVSARSSMFHVRLRTKDPGAYDDAGQRIYLDLFQQGLDRLRGKPVDGGFRERVALWREQKPDGFNDHRKLLAAVLLLRYPE